VVAVQDSSTLCGTTDNSRRLFSKNLSFLTIHGHFVPLYIPHMLPTWDPDGGSTPEGREVSSTLPQRLVRVLLECHSCTVASLFRPLHKQEKVPKERRASTLGVIGPA
jgi:hypothetical protein